jgi:GNAT superfamily N-acetyltransferase
MLRDDGVVRVECYTDGREALEHAREFLVSRPVDHNVILTILRDRVARPEPGRYWIARNGQTVVGFALQSPPTFKAALAPSPPEVLHALVDAMTADAPDLPGVTGEAASAARFAGRWAEVRKLPVTPVEGGRLYRLGQLRMPAVVPGALRRAGPDDRGTLVAWARAFHAETNPGPSDPEDTVTRRIEDGRFFVWDDSGPAAMAFATAPIEGVARVGMVYTPPDRRGHGYASACVASLSRHALDADAKVCILYTQLQNPTSNGVYQRLGYEAVSEIISYRFG